MTTDIKVGDFVTYKERIDLSMEDRERGRTPWVWMTAIVVNEKRSFTLMISDGTETIERSADVRAATPSDIERFKQARRAYLQSELAKLDQKE